MAFPLACSLYKLKTKRNPLSPGLWNRRYFVVRAKPSLGDFFMCYYANEAKALTDEPDWADAVALADISHISLLGVSGRLDLYAASNKMDKTLVAELYEHKMSIVEIETPGRSYFLRADSRRDLMYWASGLQRMAGLPVTVSWPADAGPQLPVPELVYRTRISRGQLDPEVRKQFEAEAEARAAKGARTKPVLIMPQLGPPTDTFSAPAASAGSVVGALVPSAAPLVAQARAATTPSAAGLGLSSEPVTPQPSAAHSSSTPSTVTMIPSAAKSASVSKPTAGRRVVEGMPKMRELVLDGADLEQEGAEEMKADNRSSARSVEAATASRNTHSAGSTRAGNTRPAALLPSADALRANPSSAAGSRATTPDASVLDQTSSSVNASSLSLASLAGDGLSKQSSIEAALQKAARGSDVAASRSVPRSGGATGPAPASLPPGLPSRPPQRTGSLPASLLDDGDSDEDVDYSAVARTASRQSASGADAATPIVVQEAARSASQSAIRPAAVGLIVREAAWQAGTRHEWDDDDTESKMGEGPSAEPGLTPSSWMSRGEEEGFAGSSAGKVAETPPRAQAQATGQHRVQSSAVTQHEWDEESKEAEVGSSPPAPSPAPSRTVLAAPANRVGDPGVNADADFVQANWDD